ncbi:hypothetical protein EDD86DRAFT_47681 [Gorgonomyces haynaldii]|nr:hypothetical protein EDD86DRAFT_47681 [Gorgonomyces haynaldii]
MLFNVVAALPKVPVVPADGSLPAAPGYVYVECTGPKGSYGELWTAKNIKTASITKAGNGTIQHKSTLSYKPTSWKSRAQFNGVTGASAQYTFGTWDVQVPAGAYTPGVAAGQIVDTTDNLQWTIYTAVAPAQKEGQLSCTPKYFALDQPQSLPYQEALPVAAGYVLAHCYSPQYGSTHQIWSSSDMSQIALCGQGQCHIEHLTLTYPLVNWEATPSVSGVPDALTGKPHTQWNFKIAQIGSKQPTVVEEPTIGTTWQLIPFRYATPLQAGEYQCLPSFYTLP